MKRDIKYIDEAGHEITAARWVQGKECDACQSLARLDAKMVATGLVSPEAIKKIKEQSK